MRPRSFSGGRAAVALLVLAVVGPLLAFLDKPFHVDDPVFVYTARHIRRDPLHPYGFPLNWYGRNQTAWVVNENPPVLGYYLAAIRARGERGNHLAMIPWALAAGLGAFALAARLGLPPLVSSLLVVATPAFFVSATTLMADVPLLAIFVGCLVAFQWGLSRRSTAGFVISGTLGALAVFTKYSGVTVIPLLLAWGFLWQTASRRGRPAAQPGGGRWWLAPGLAGALVLAIVGAGEATGGSHFLKAAGYPHQPWSSGPVFARHLVALLTFLSGTTLFPVVLAPLLARRHPVAAGLSVLGGGLAGWAAHRFPLLPPAAPLGGGQIAAIALLAATSLLALWSAGRASWRSKTVHSRVLGLWLFGLLGFIAFFYWTVAGKLILLLTIPLALLLLIAIEGLSRRARIAWLTASVLATAVGSGLVARADLLAARTYPDFAASLLDRFPERRNDIAFVGQWGMHYYFEKAGFRLATEAGEGLFVGGLLIAPAIAPNGNVRPEVMPYLSPAMVKRVEETFPVRSINQLAGAGFYSHHFGLLPWTVSRAPLEIFVLFNVREAP